MKLNFTFSGQFNFFENNFAKVPILNAQESKAEQNITLFFSGEK